MKYRVVCLTLLIGVLSLGAACSPASQPESTPAPTAAPAQAEPAPPANALTGTWIGDWGPSPSDRNAVTVELIWNGTTLTGVVNPGPNAVALTKAVYDPATGAIMMEADSPGRDGGTVHFIIEGKAAGDSMSGSWSHDDVKGDFKITKS